MAKEKFFSQGGTPPLRIFTGKASGRLRKFSTMNYQKPREKAGEFRPLKTRTGRLW